jgi:hypothetical protein
MAFNLPVQNYFNRTTGPEVYSRPADWPVITDVATEVQFLFCNLGDSTCQIRTNFTRSVGSQNITIDWGDGFSNVISSTATTNTTHTYAPGSGTPCSLGYNTFKIRVYFTGTGTSVLDNCNILPVLISGDIGSLQGCPVLEAYYGDSTQNATPLNFLSQGVNVSQVGLYNYLQFVKLPATVSWGSWSNMFYGCVSLLKVVMPTSNSAASQYSNAFSYCNDLLEITFPSNSTGILSLSQTFTGCSNLRSVTFPTTLNACSNISFCFQNCFNLRSVTLPSINGCNNFQLTFYACYQLEWVKFTSMPTLGGSILFGSAFSTCFNLQNVYFPATGTAASIYDFNGTFSACYQLKSIVLPSNINVSRFGNTFSSCYALTSCILPTSAAACTEYTYTFNSCFSLTKITLPAAPTSSVSFSNCFFSCYKLEQITIPAGYIFTDMTNICANCYSLKTFTWTPGIQNSLLTLNNAFQQCYILTSITMPSSMNALTNLSSVFPNCYILNNVIFPSSLNLVTTMQGCFTNCYLLISVTLPTSMSVCNNFSSTFNTCKSIVSVTLPNTVGNVTTFSSCFLQCFSLKTCVLPGAVQLSLVTAIDNMFTLCSNLTTLTNFNKIGSLTATPLMSATGMQYNKFTGGSAISFSAPLIALNLSGAQSTIRTNVQEVRLTNISAGQWTSGSSPQINVSFTNMSTANLVQLFNDMAAQPAVSGKTINITSATGAAGLTLANRQIITTKGWTITG